MAILRRCGLVLLATVAFCLPSQALAIGTPGDSGSEQPVVQVAHPR
jgi:hypothetical protein